MVGTVDRLLNHAPTRRAALELLLPRADDLAADWSAAATGVSPEADELLDSCTGSRAALAGAA